ncbi:MAG: hypothetical protein WCK27_26390 [Verrucomicrobiota bacterium]
MLARFASRRTDAREFALRHRVLLIQTGTGRGQGYVKLAVRPRSDLPVGTAIPTRCRKKREL